MAGAESWFEHKGGSVQLGIDATVPQHQVVVVDGWHGISAGSGDSGDTIAVTIEQAFYQVSFPTGLSLSVGDVVYIEEAQVSGHVPADAAYSTSSGAGKIAAFKVAEELDGDTNTWSALLLPQS